MALSLLTPVLAGRLKIVELSGAKKKIRLNEDNSVVKLRYGVKGKMSKKQRELVEAEGGIPFEFKFSKSNNEVGLATIPEKGFIPLLENGEFGTETVIIFQKEQ